MQEKHLISVPKYRDRIITWIHGPLLFCGIFNKDIPFILMSNPNKSVLSHESQRLCPYSDALRAWEMLKPKGRILDLNALESDEVLLSAVSLSSNVIYIVKYVQ